jgi:hypothetical protein
MGTNIGNKDVVTKGSGHVAPGPTPGMCLGPPPTPAGTPTPGVPFVFVSKSSSATDCVPTTKLKIKGKAVVREGSALKIEMPGTSLVRRWSAWTSCRRPSTSSASS